MFCTFASNPVKYVDPDGRTEEIPFWNVYARNIGTKVHTAVESYLIDFYEGECEQFIEGGGKNGKNGRADYVRGLEIYEIKPITQINKSFGKEQLQRYVEHKRYSRKGTSILAQINNELLVNVTIHSEIGLCNVKADIRLITFPNEKNQAGMIYYQLENVRLDFSPSKYTLMSAGAVALTLALSYFGVKGISIPQVAF